MANDSSVTAANGGTRQSNFIDSLLRTKNGEMVALSGYKFQEIWNYYDKDSSGYLEREEIEAFLQDYLTSSAAGTTNFHPDETERENIYHLFLDQLDDNKDGRISACELMNLLPVTEAVYLAFRMENSLESGTDYMQVWKKYDKDISGFIEAHELKDFLRDVCEIAAETDCVSETYLDEYAKTMMCVYNGDKDGKLRLSELSKMLPQEENFVQLLVDKAAFRNKINDSDVDDLLDLYDKDRSGYLEGSEITRLAHELLLRSREEEPYDASDVFSLEQSLLKGIGKDQHGRISRGDLAMIIKTAAVASGKYNEKPARAGF